MFSKITLLGNVGRTPELKTSKAGKDYCSFSVAVNEGYGEKKTTTWYNVSVFGEAAPTASKILGKGSSVYIEGRPSSRSYMAKDGTPKAEISVLADRWYITEKKSTAADGPSLDQDFPF
jgi:hypothetical protein